MSIETKKLSLTIVIVVGFILIMSTLLTIITWYMAPLFIPDIQILRSVSTGPPIEKILLQTIGLGEKADFESVQINVWTKPTKIQEDKETELFLEILDSSNKPIDLDTSIHYTWIHTYAIKSDLSGSTIHLHPTETSKKSGIWRTLITFPSGGVWHLVSQTSKDGIVYQITSALKVGGENPSVFIPNFLREKELDNWKVQLSLDKKNVKAGEPTKFTFKLTPLPGKEPTKLNWRDLEYGHNLIVTRLNDSFIWNQHGDGSVEKISAEVNLPIKRVPINREPFAYTIIFPKAGVWLVNVEFLSKDIRFFVEVNDKD